MSFLYGSDQMELMMDSNLVCGAPSSSEQEVDMFVLERFISNYGPSLSSSPSMFYIKKEERSSDQDSDPQVVDHHHDSTTTSVQYHGGGSSDDLESKFGDHHRQHDHHDVDINGINRSTLIRQSSSPPEFFSHLTLDNNGGGRLGNDQLSFSSRSPTCATQMPQIIENGNDSNWDNSSFNALKTARDHNDLKMFPSSSAMEIQNTEFGNCGGTRGGLTHHLSMPKNFGMPGREKILHVQGAPVPCKMRAKRGFATHPRSIAERVRRTRISERMRRLEGLFPNMDKQTTIADKLELAVEYIKDLQKQVKTLTDTKAKCSCSSKQKQHSNPCP